MSRICLTMIVKNESAVIARAIAAVRHLVDCFAIVDTGSTDNTEEVARAALDGLPGEYLRSTWKGYGPSRTQSMQRAEEVGADYALIVDADDIWRGTKPTLSGDEAYSVWFERPGARWTTTRLLKLGIGMRYEGVVHEMPVLADGSTPSATLISGLSVTSPNDGATYADPNKYLEHARMIATAMVDDPANPRYAFYLAQSYRDHGDDARAVVLYLARAAMGPGNYPEEVYCSYLEAGRALLRMKHLSEAKRALMNAHLAYPGRREAMAELARVFAVMCASSPTVGTLFVEQIEGLADEAAE